MDPIEDLLKSYESDITVEKLQRLIVLQNEKVSILKKAKLYWTCYGLQNEKRKKVTNQTLSNINSTQYSEIKLSNQTNNLKNNNLHKSNSLNSRQVLNENLTNNKISQNESKVIKRSTNSQLVQTQQIKVQSQPLGVVTNALLSSNVRFILPDYQKLLQDMKPPLTTDLIPKVDQYLNSTVVSALTADIVCKYYSDLFASRCFENNDQNNLLYRKDLPNCFQCGSEMSCLWHKIDSKYRCHICTSYFDTSVKPRIPDISLDMNKKKPKLLRFDPLKEGELIIVDTNDGFEFEKKPELCNQKVSKVGSSEFTDKSKNFSSHLKYPKTGLTSHTNKNQTFSMEIGLKPLPPIHKPDEMILHSIQKQTGKIQQKHIPKQINNISLLSVQNKSLNAMKKEISSSESNNHY